MPAAKKKTDEEISALMQEFRTQRVRVQDFCTERGISAPSFRRWKREWDVKEKEARLAELPDKPLAWMPPHNLKGKGDPITNDPLLTLIVDLADNLGPHTDQCVQLTLCFGGMLVSGRLIGGQEYMDLVRNTVLRMAMNLLEPYQRECEKTLNKLLPDTERLPERREDWDEFYTPDDYRDKPEFIHLADVTIQGHGTIDQAAVWRGKISAVAGFWIGLPNEDGLQGV